MLMGLSKTQYRILDGFNDTHITRETWNELLHQGPVDEIFLTWEWQKTWWETFGRGKLLLIALEENGKPLVIAPLFSDGGMIFFVGSGGSDYLDFIGEITNVEILENLLLAAIDQIPDFCGFRFYHVPDGSPTGRLLEKAAIFKNWQYFDEGSLPSPFMEIKNMPQQAEQATRKKSLVRHENWFIKMGGLRIDHFNKSDDILPHLDSFFDQHVARWESTPFPSLFKAEIQRTFYKRICEAIAPTCCLQFTVITWQEKPIAFHFGFWYQNKFLWYKPCFDITLAKYSPGEVLIRQLLLHALNENAAIFDFGLGDEEFKKRFATHTRIVRTWGIYPEISDNKN